MVLNPNVALVILTILQCVSIIAYFYSIKQIKVNAKRISRKDMSRYKNLVFSQKLNLISHLVLAVVMVIKTNIENTINFSESHEVLWLIDIVIMAIATISFVWRIYKNGKQQNGSGRQSYIHQMMVEMTLFFLYSGKVDFKLLSCYNI